MGSVFVAVGAVVFLLLVVVVCGLLVFPAAGERALDRWERVRGWIGARLGGAGRSASRHGEVLRGSVRHELSGLGEGLRRHAWVIAAAALLLVVPPAVILLTRQNVVLDDFQSEDMNESSTMIAQLLRGERLMPPAPPPPQVFTTEEIRRVMPEIVTADRKWERIDADLQQRVLAIFEVMRRQYGYEMVLVEGFRSPERQAELMSGGKATRAGAWQSCHQYGLAVDAAPIRDGKLQWNMEDPWTGKAYAVYGQLAQQAGLDWGGAWRSIKDYVHVELAQQCRSARAAKRAELARG
ncbi:M15 family metallopeptidase [Xanthomonas maliensis]|uniref:M15 family metallopeptidase n=1 Tax=Xanthomonas maliensis TaxID=1321368 RepID=UPI0003B749A6|nr:M15 family metallopeptidase [Xanthomonas maliensis]KAB7769657.1 hypothetical protein CKY51_05785 [Xanthomonas maliensis]